MFEFGENLFDGVQVRGVFGQEEELGSCLSDCMPDSLAFVASKIVHDNDLARFQRRDQTVLDPGEEHLAIDRAIEEAGSLYPIVAKRRDKGHGPPSAKGRLSNDALAARPPSTKRGHIGLRPSFVDEDQALGINPPLILPPLLTPALDVFSILLLCGYGFFYGSGRANGETPRPSGDPPSDRERFEVRLQAG